MLAPFSTEKKRVLRMHIENSVLYKLMKDKSLRSIWVGENPPLPGLESSALPMKQESYFRAKPEMHGCYDLVISHEADFGEIKQWPLILDEILRLLKPNSVLSLRVRPSKLISVYHVKKILFSLFADGLELLEETKWLDESIIMTVKVNRKVVAPAKEGWTFGIIYDGSKLNNLTEFIKSVEGMRGLREYEIVICGPRVDAMETDRVKFVEFTDKFSTYGWITEKKNVIVKEAQFENLCILHNRYVLDPGFLEGFEQFGYDFDAISCRQIEKNGRRFPDWVATSGWWTLNAVSILEINDYNHNIYINGGFIVAKRTTLLKNPWNPLIFWNQAEDVELSRRLSEAGIVARFNPYSTAVVLENRKDYTEFFIKIPFVKNSWVSPIRGVHHPEQYISEAGVIYQVGIRRGLTAKILVPILTLVFPLMLKIYQTFFKPHYKKLKPWLSGRPTLMRFVRRTRERIKFLVDR